MGGGGGRCCNICISNHLRVSLKLLTRKAALDFTLFLSPIEKEKRLNAEARPMSTVVFTGVCLSVNAHVELSMISISVAAPCRVAMALWSIYVLNLPDFWPLRDTFEEEQEEL